MNIKSDNARIRNVPQPNRPVEILANSNPRPPLKNPISVTPEMLWVIYPSNKLNHNPAKTERIKAEKRETNSRLNTSLKPRKNKSGGIKKAEMPSHW